MKNDTNSARMPLLMPDDFSSLHLCGWRVEEGKNDPNNPLIEGEMPWEEGGVGIHGTILKDPIDGVWKAWIVTTPPEETSEGWPKPWASVANDRDRSICYYESVDGINWTRPVVPDSAYGDYKETNIIFDSNKFGLQAYASVIVDPDNKEWPYEMFVLQTATEIVTPPNGCGYNRYRSKDGKGWEWFGGPITGCILGDVLFAYKRGELSEDYPYLGYYRTGEPPKEGDHLPAWEDGCSRTAFRCYSEDGVEWIKDPEMVIARDERDHRDTQFMEVVPIRVPGGYIALVSIYHPITQTLDLRMAASRDGQRWWFPDRRPCMPNRPLGEYGGGMIWQSRILSVEDGNLYLYYAGSEGPHRQIIETGAPSIEIGYLENALDHGGHFLPFTTALCRATWEYDRMFALASNAGGPTIGVATTKPAEIAGKSLLLNLKTRPQKKASKPGVDEGYLQVELLDADGNPIPGFTREDCQPVKGDYRLVKVQWKGGEQSPANATQARFYLKRTFLYGFEFRA